MKRKKIAAFALACLAGLYFAVPQASAASAQALAQAPHIQLQGMHKSGVIHPDAGINLVYHGGKVMLSSVTYLIYWEPPTLQTGGTAHVSATYNSLLARYFRDVRYSGIYKNDTQYYETVNSVNEYPSTLSTRGGTWLDTSPYPASGCTDSSTPGNCLTDAQIQAEVAKAMQANGWTGGTNHMFFVYTAASEGSCTDATGSACAFTDYCAYHAYFKLPNKQYVVYANMPYTGSDLAACGVSASPNNDLDADSTINATSREHMDAVTDPFLDGWYQNSTTNTEVGDMCHAVFGDLTLDGGKADVNWSGHYYDVQAEWDNTSKSCALTGP